MTSIQRQNFIDDVPERVLAGVAFLDDYHPGWEYMIDMKRFNIENACGCIGGHLCGSYWRFIDDADLNYTRSVALGFGFWNQYQVSTFVREEKAALQREWLLAIAAKRAERKTVVPSHLIAVSITV